MGISKKFQILLCLLVFSYPIGINSQQDTIRGRILSSLTRAKPMGQISVFEKYTSNGVFADSLGYFTLVPLKDRAVYTLEIHAGSHGLMEYQYLSKWCSYKRPKSIIANLTCDIDSRSAHADFKKDSLRLYITGGIAPVMNTKLDDRFEKRYNVYYFDFGCEFVPDECILDYNKQAFFYLDYRYGDRWRRKVRKDVVGINK